LLHLKKFAVSQTVKRFAQIQLFMIVYYFNTNIFIFPVICRQVPSDDATHFKLRKVGPSEGRKVTEIKIVPKVRIQFIITYSYTYLQYPITFVM